MNGALSLKAVLNHIDDLMNDVTLYNKLIKYITAFYNSYGIL